MFKKFTRIIQFNHFKIIFKKVVIIIVVSNCSVETKIWKQYSCSEKSLEFKFQNFFYRLKILTISNNYLLQYINNCSLSY